MTSSGFGAAEHAVILGIDGLAVRTLHHAIATGHAPHLAALRASGAFTDDARCTQPSSSLPNWASTLFSAPPAFHGVHGARLDGAVRPATLPDGGLWPNIFRAAKSGKRAGVSTAAFFSWPPLRQLLPPGSLNVSVLEECASCEDCLRVEPQLLSRFEQATRRSRFTLSWLYFDALDECGHARGGDSDAYLPLVREVDGWVGRVVESLRRANLLDSTALLVMSDHGRAARGGFDHGGFTTAEMQVQWLLVGPGVRRNHRIRAPVSIMDGAPTLLHLLGIPPPVQFYGRAVLEAFERGTAEPAGAPPAWWFASENATAADVRMAPAIPRTSRPHSRPATYSKWYLHAHAPSVAVGAAIGAAAAAAAILCARKWRRRSARGDRGYERPTLAGALVRHHPAADRLRAAAGQNSGDDDEHFPLVG